jgi:hypothetical protein
MGNGADMTDTSLTNRELVEFIDEWLVVNEWRLDQTTLDFALDVRLLATGSSLRAEVAEELLVGAAN